MADTTQIDPADRTPHEVIAAIGENRSAYPSTDCIPCGAVIHIGFFFDGFGRHRDFDDPTTSRYSNICRLWEAHRENTDLRRPKTPNQFWYRFYYSGLGTDMNEEAREGLVTSAVLKTGKEIGKSAEKKAVGIGKKVAGVDRLAIKPQSAISVGVKKGLEDFSYRPIVKSFNDLVGKVTSAPKNVGRVLRLERDDRWVRRARAAARAILYDAKKNPMKAGWDTAKEVFIGVALDSIPWCRDNRAVARLFGTGVEDRVAAAKNQFEKAIEDTKLKMPKIQRIQVSIFGGRPRWCACAGTGKRTDGKVQTSERGETRVCRSEGPEPHGRTDRDQVSRVARCRVVADGREQGAGHGAGSQHDQAKLWWPEARRA